MVGVGSFYRLPQHLLKSLYAKGLHYLVQVGVENGNPILRQGWKTVEGLSLTRRLQVEWDKYV